MTALHDRIRSVLPVRDARWYEGLAATLAAQEWSQLARAGIDPSNYGSARVLRNNPSTLRLGSAMSNPGLGRPVQLERFDTLMLARYGVIGLREPKPDFDASYFQTAFAQAIRLIDVAAAAGESVRSLVWSITPVGVEGPDYDTGYSDPALPFSIFIGAHAVSDKVAAIRLAEGVLHETMHLQLSLIEDWVPLVGGSGGRRHSPWQKCDRPTQGVLHGLYVFRVVQDWLRVIVAGTALEGADLAHAKLRISQIEEECAELTDLAASDDLTSDGRVLAAALAY